MKKNITLIILCALAAGLGASCATGGEGFEPGEAVYEPAAAEGFTIYAARSEGDAGGRVIRITDPWQGAEGVEQWVFVAEDGEEPPANFSGTVVKGPARRIVCMSSSYVAFLSELGAADRIVGVSGGGFITDPEVSERIKAGDIADVGYESGLDFERLAELKPDLMLVYGVRSGNEGGVAAKLREMGVPCVFVGEYLESTPQGRAEWTVAIGAMCGLTEEAERRFGEITRAYDDLRARAAAIMEADGEGRPEVMFGVPYRDVWYVPGDDNYMVKLVRDAGGEYVCRGVGGSDSRPIDIEEAYVAMQRADFWLGTGSYDTIAALLADNPRFAGVPPVSRGAVYNNNARRTPAGGSDFWESGAVRPDRVLRDMVTILHPEATADSTLYYYRRLE